MQIQFDTAQLKACLTASAKVAGKRTTIPSLSHVLIETDSQGACFSVTDLEVSRQQWLKYQEPSTDWPTWKVAVSVGALLKCLPKSVKDLKRSPLVTLESKPDCLLAVSIGGAESVLRCSPREEFPTLPIPEGCDDVTEPAVMAGDAFRDLVGKVFTSISTEESRFQLSGALLECNGQPRMVATDGHTLHLADGAYKVAPASDMSALIPRWMLACSLTDPALGPQKRYQKVGEYKAGKRRGEPRFGNVQVWPDVYVSTSEHHIFIATSRGVRYNARILEGTFPDYNRVIKTDPPECEIVTSAGDMVRALEAVSHMTGDRARAIRLDLDGEFPRFSAKNPDRGDSHVVLNGSTELFGKLLRESTSLGINPDYILRALKRGAKWTVPEDSMIHLRMYDENSQTVLHADADPSLRVVIMPIRI